MCIATSRSSKQPDHSTAAIFTSDSQRSLNTGLFTSAGGLRVEWGLPQLLPVLIAWTEPHSKVGIAASTPGGNWGLEKLKATYLPDFSDRKGSHYFSPNTQKTLDWHTALSTYQSLLLSSLSWDSRMIWGYKVPTLISPWCHPVLCPLEFAFGSTQASVQSILLEYSLSYIHPHRRGTDGLPVTSVILIGCGWPVTLAYIHCSHCFSTCFQLDSIEEWMF
jgi:hypothetical protein